MIRTVKYLLVPVLLISLGCATSSESSKKSNPYAYEYFAQYEYQQRYVPNATLSGSVRGAQTGLPLRARITFMGTNVKSINTDVSGEFSIVLPSGTYTVIAEAEGFYPERKYVVLLPNESKTVGFILIHKNR